MARSSEKVRLEGERESQGLGGRARQNLMLFLAAAYRRTRRSPVPRQKKLKELTGRMSPSNETVSPLNGDSRCRDDEPPSASFLAHTAPGLTVVQLPSHSVILSCTQCRLPPSTQALQIRVKDPVTGLSHVGEIGKQRSPPYLISPHLTSPHHKPDPPRASNVGQR